jgi:hypothetical protein
MKSVWKFTVALLLTVSLFVGCSEAPKLTAPDPSQPNVSAEDQLLVSDTRNIGILDLSTGKMEVVRNKLFLQSIQFDKRTGNVLAPVYSPDPVFLGLLEFHGSKKKEIHLEDEGFAPIRLYQYENSILTNSARALREGDATVTEVAFFNLDTGKLEQKQVIKGIVRSFAGEGNLAYIAAHHYPGENPSALTKHSNIYEVDMKAKSLRPIFPENQAYVPLEIGVKNGKLYGVYQTYPNDKIGYKKDQFVWIDPATGETKKTVDLNPYARFLRFSTDGKYAYVSHLYAIFNPESNVKAPLSRINLETFEVDTLEGSFRAASMAEWDHKLYVGDELKNTITVIDEETFQIEKTIPSEISPVYLASRHDAGNQHIQ